MYLLDRSAKLSMTLRPASAAFIDEAFGFELQGARRRGDGLPVVVAQQAIPLKAD